MKNKTRWSIAMPMLALLGCASTGTVMNGYDGPERSDREVAILFTPEIDPPSYERRGGVLSAVGGKTVGSFMDGYPRATKVLPGEYLIKVGCLDMILKNNMDFRLLRARFEAGRYYELVCERSSVAALDRGASYKSVEHLLPASVKDQLRR